MAMRPSPSFLRESLAPGLNTGRNPDCFLRNRESGLNSRVTGIRVSETDSRVRGNDAGRPKTDPGP